ncbi:MAG: DUF1801 domain-containing protein [Chloroflexota bacterium]
MSDLKTKPTDESVTAFLDSVEDEKKREDSYAVMDLMREVTGEAPKMWGDSIVGFGSYHYRYESGREGDWFLVGFAPRKRNLSLYIMSGFEEYDDLLDELGKHKTGKSCLYINRMDDVDEDVLRRLVRQSVAHMRETNE